MAEVWQSVLDHGALMRERKGSLRARRSEQSMDWMSELIALGLEEMFGRHPRVRARVPQLEHAVRDGAKTPFRRRPRELLPDFHFRQVKGVNSCHIPFPVMTAGGGGSTDSRWLHHRLQRIHAGRRGQSDSRCAGSKAEQRARRRARHSQVGVLTGASTGPSVDGALAKANASPLPHALPVRFAAARADQRRARFTFSTCTFRCCRSRCAMGSWARCTGRSWKPATSRRAAASC